MHTQFSHPTLREPKGFNRGTIIIIIIIIIKRISRAPICHTRWEHRALYNKTLKTDTDTKATDKD